VDSGFLELVGRHPWRPRDYLSEDGVISLGESLLQELESPRELILTEPVPEVVEFLPTD